MKQLNKVFFFVTIMIMTSVSYNSANAERDCSNPKGFHQKMACKIQGASSSSESSLGEPKKERGAIGGFFKKIKDFGGKNVGSEG